jgi:hypothetical protein
MNKYISNSTYNKGDAYNRNRDEYINIFMKTNLLERFYRKEKKKRKMVTSLRDWIQRERRIQTLYLQTLYIYIYIYILCKLLR